MPALHRSFCRFAFLAIVLLSSGFLSAAEAPLFNRDIRPILSANCFQCHGPDDKHREADLRLDDEAGIVGAFSGSLEKSEAWRRITSKEPDTRMPPVDSHLELKPEQITLLKAWIESGSKWEGHWSFIAPQKPPVPTTSQPDWIRNPIDAFILKRLEESGLAPNGPAQLERVLRRVTFDLTGLPPTIIETISRFAATWFRANHAIIRFTEAPRRTGARQSNCRCDPLVLQRTRRRPLQGVTQSCRSCACTTRIHPPVKERPRSRARTATWTRRVGTSEPGLMQTKPYSGCVIPYVWVLVDDAVLALVDEDVCAHLGDRACVLLALLGDWVVLLHVLLMDERETR